MKMFELSKFHIFVNKCFKQLWTLQLSLSVIQFDNFFRSQEAFTRQKSE